jgi:hypothetical protein
MVEKKDYQEIFIGTILGKSKEPGDFVKCTD